MRVCFCQSLFAAGVQRAESGGAGWGRVGVVPHSTALAAQARWRKGLSERPSQSSWLANGCHSACHLETRRALKIRILSAS